MKRTLSFAFVSLFCVLMGAKTLAQEKSLRHVVSFKFKADVSTEEIDDLVMDFADLKNEIPQIKSFEWGENNSPEGLNKEMTYCFILTFKSAADRAIYLPHPAHKAFGDKYAPIVEDVFVIDFYAQYE